MKIRILCLLLIGSVVAACGESNPDAEKAGAQVAQQWLEIVDRGDYGDSWNQAAPGFKSTITEADWINLVDGVRSPLGANVSRTLSKTQYATSMPGRPDGEYVVSVFNATYEEKEHAIETVTSKKIDGEWLVAGYFIR